MNIKGYINNQEDIEITLSITMKLQEWKSLQKDLPEHYPNWKLGSAITSAVLKLGEVVSEEIKED